MRAKCRHRCTSRRLNLHHKSKNFLLSRYSHFKLYWKTFSAETRVIAIDTCLNLNLKNYILYKIQFNSRYCKEKEAISPRFNPDLLKLLASQAQNILEAFSSRTPINSY